MCWPMILIFLDTAVDSIGFISTVVYSYPVRV
jgi:hypothetical protein